VVLGGTWQHGDGHFGTEGAKITAGEVQQHHILNVFPILRIFMSIF
jgi:hypothetical protein